VVSRPATIRPARAADLPAVRAVVDAAYTIYLPRLGKPPGPMLDDHAARIGSGRLWVLEAAEGVVGVLVVLERDDHLLMDNVAVLPAHQGRGLGRMLVAFAEAEARRCGHPELRLYTHELMVENIAFYGRLGFAENHRAEEKGYRRVYMSKVVRR
jgi:GNAT superfamily N-acetyltransferase